jgi:hypothetical protein
MILKAGIDQIRGEIEENQKFDCWLMIQVHKSETKD